MVLPLPSSRSVFYCMNEKELLEAAIEYLRDADRKEAPLQTDQQVEEKPTEAPRKDEPIILQRTAKQIKTSDESTDCSEDLDATYVSETDLDIAERETVPYTESQQHAGSKGQRSESDLDRGQISNPNMEREKEKEQSQTPCTPEDDDSLRLVREIFFT